MSFSLDLMWTYLLDGNWLGFLGSLWVSAVGEMSYTLIYASVIILVQSRLESWASVAILYLAFAPYMVVMIISSGWGILSLVLYLGMGGLLYGLARRSI